MSRTRAHIHACQSEHPLNSLFNKHFKIIISSPFAMSESEFVQRSRGWRNRDLGRLWPTHAWYVWGYQSGTPHSCQSLPPRQRHDHSRPSNKQNQRCCSDPNGQGRKTSHDTNPYRHSSRLPAASPVAINPDPRCPRTT